MDGDATPHQRLSLAVGAQGANSTQGPQVERGQDFMDWRMVLANSDQDAHLGLGALVQREQALQGGSA